MEHRHVELLRPGYRAYADSDVTTLSALYSDDVVFHVSGHNPVGAKNLIRRTGPGTMYQKERRYLPSDLRPVIR